jgi:hypothetical protein
MDRPAPQTLAFQYPSEGRCPQREVQRRLPALVATIWRVDPDRPGASRRITPLGAEIVFYNRLSAIKVPFNITIENNPRGVAFDTPFRCGVRFSGGFSENAVFRRLSDCQEKERTDHQRSCPVGALAYIRSGSALMLISPLLPSTFYHTAYLLGIERLRQHIPCAQIQGLRP